MAAAKAGKGGKGKSAGKKPMGAADVASDPSGAAAALAIGAEVAQEQGEEVMMEAASIAQAAAVVAANDAADAANNAADESSDGADGAADAASDAVDAAADVAGDAVEAVAGGVAGAVEVAADVASDATDVAVDMVSEAADVAADVASDTADLAASVPVTVQAVGQQAMEGAIDAASGIAAGAAEVAGALQGAAETVGQQVAAATAPPPTRPPIADTMPLPTSPADGEGDVAGTQKLLVNMLASLDRGAAATLDQMERVELLVMRLERLGGPVSLSWEAPGKFVVRRSVHC
jgi:hypothetical protein